MIDWNPISTLISAVVSSIIAWIVSYYTVRKSIAKQYELWLENQILQINQIAIEYPYLEDNDFCSKWIDNNNPKEERYMRYDNYCCIVFNLLENLWKYFKGSKSKIESFLSVQEMAIRHKNWWKNPSGIIENIVGYDLKFQKYINSFII